MSSDTPARVYCPDCMMDAEPAQWHTILRWVREAGRGSRKVAVLRHRVCNGIAFVMLD